MSHPFPGHDYSEKHKEESSKQYGSRKSKALSRVKENVKGSKAVALIRMKNKDELAHAAKFDKKFGSFEERLKKFGKEMK